MSLYRPNVALPRAINLTQKLALHLIFLWSPLVSRVVSCGLLRFYADPLKQVIKQLCALWQKIHVLRNPAGEISFAIWPIARENDGYAYSENNFCRPGDRVYCSLCLFVQYYTTFFVHVTFNGANKVFLFLAG